MKGFKSAAILMLASMVSSVAPRGFNSPLRDRTPNKLESTDPRSPNRMSQAKRRKRYRQKMSSKTFRITRGIR